MILATSIYGAIALGYFARLVASKPKDWALGTKAIEKLTYAIVAAVWPISVSVEIYDAVRRPS